MLGIGCFASWGRCACLQSTAWRSRQGACAWDACALLSCCHAHQTAGRPSCPQDRLIAELRQQVHDLQLAAAHGRQSAAQDPAHNTLTL